MEFNQRNTKKKIRQQMHTAKVGPETPKLGLEIPNYSSGTCDLGPETLNYSSGTQKPGTRTLYFSSLEIVTLLPHTRHYIMASPLCSVNKSFA